MVYILHFFTHLYIIGVYILHIFYSFSKMRVLGFKYLDLYWQTREYKLVLLLAINFFLIHYEMGVVEKNGLVFFHFFS